MNLPFRNDLHMLMGWWIIGFSYHMMGKSMANQEVMEKIYGLRDFIEELAVLMGYNEIKNYLSQLGLRDLRVQLWIDKLISIYWDIMNQLLKNCQELWYMKCSDIISSRKLWKTHLQLPDPPSRCGVPTIF